MKPDQTRKPHGQADAGGAQPQIRFSGIQKSYDGATNVVEDLDLDVARGEFLTLLGPSGSGKTTTLMMLAGFEQPSSGDIFVDGQRINDLPTFRRNFGVVFQNYALFPHMTVAQNLAFPLRMHKVAKEEIPARVRKALQTVKMQDFSERMPGQLSGGQQQRIALARALVFEPKMVLMDEPLGALDKQLREHMQLEIRELHRKLGITMLYVTHDQSEALTMSDRIAVFHEGRIQQIADPQTIYERPSNPFVASFIGENNRIEGRVERISGEDVTVRTDHGALISASARTELSTGEAVHVVIRPERVALAGRSGDGATQVKAVIREVIYHGDHLRVAVEAEGCSELVARIPHDDDLAVPAEGEACQVSWHRRNALAFAKPQGGAA